MSRQCPRCGHLAEDSDRYCASCGADLAGATAVPDAADAADAGEAAFQTGVLGVRAASEGDSAPLPTVDPTSVGGLGAGHAVLVVLRGPQEGARFDLDPSAGTVILGRAPESDLFLDDVTVSRRHAELTATAGGGWEIVDLGSLNGSYVNRRRIDRADLTGGDELQIGKYRFVFLTAAGGGA